MRVPPFSNILSSILVLSELSLPFILFLALTIVVPGFFIWLGLRVIDEERSIIHCGIANLVALTIATFVTFIVNLVPLIPLIPFFVFIKPIVFFLIYLFVLKVVLDIELFEALVATLIAIAIIFAIAFIMLILTGFWYISFTPSPTKFYRF